MLVDNRMDNELLVQTDNGVLTLTVDRDVASFNVPVLLKHDGLKHKRSASAECLSSPASPEKDDLANCFSNNCSLKDGSYCSPGALARSRSPSPPAVGIRPSIKSLCQYQSRAKLRGMVQEITRGFESGVEPECLTDGLGGCYVFKSDTGKKVAVVKPTDEEPLAPNNPKGFVGRGLGDPGLKPTVRVGEAGLREAAAYLLDHQHFAQVPCTSLARMTHGVFNHNQGQPRQRSKLVSIQEFVEHQYDASDVGTAMFPVDAVHRIGILDIRLFNTDRHSGNILVCKKDQVVEAGAPVPNFGGGGSKSFSFPSVDLVPIDHGFCLPETLETVYFEWLHWPQASMPFSESELEYIEKLDYKADVAMLNRELPMLRVQSLRLLEVSTTLLKMCARAGLNLAEIGSVMSSPMSGFDEEKSELERLCILAKEEAVFNSSINRRYSLRESDEEGSGGRGGGGDDDEGYFEDSDMEDSMFEMDDILSPAQLSTSSRSSYSPDSPSAKALEYPGFSPVSPLKSLRVGKGLHGGCEAGSSSPLSGTPRSPRINISRRHSSMCGVETSPWQFTGAKSVCHHTHASDMLRAKPVSCDMPSRELKGLFSDMDADTWHLFCKILFGEVERCLEQGSWKTLDVRAQAHLGTSAPV
ncbi:PI3K/PI4K domain-containing protein [Chloropicon primus]|uniref:1-phosphatidylinositol 4-kinase n=1 Tax=Chloropicon primus TaxID=1764295 RepID=A0A5B8MF66_9CHLO|nr:hypothetical protein A3770_02p14390 [Chloropicon primus]UPQ98129.1 PI3K/PI4K domain-containing protein [Chloropicon primus]|eukprot:QDZ18921.1 hypothetical protein A3770_02p14390 [Chloropicon primus]